MKALPPPDGLDPDLSDGLPAVAHEVLRLAEQALQNLRENTVGNWIMAGAAWKTMQLAAMYRSNSNQPAGRRYSQAYRLLEQPWPHLTKIDKGARSNAVWLFEYQGLVKPWLATLSQKERDRWTHPTTIRRHYEKRYPPLLIREPRGKERPPRQARGRGGQPLGELNREELESYIADLEDQLADRDREIIDLNNQLEEKHRTIAQLQNDNVWLKIEASHLRGIVSPPVAAEEAHENCEVVPPVQFDKPHMPVGRGRCSWRSRQRQVWTSCAGCVTTTACTSTHSKPRHRVPAGGSSSGSRNEFCSFGEPYVTGRHVTARMVPAREFLDG